MAINFALSQPGQSFAQGFEITNRMMQLAADKQAGEALAKGDRAGASATLARSGFLENADAITQRGLNQEQMKAATEASQAATRQSNVAADATADADRINFTIRAATALKDVLDRDGPQAVGPAFDMMTPLLRTRGINDQQIAELRNSLTTDPVRVLPGILQAAAEKLNTVVPPGAVIANTTTGKEIYKNPMQYNPLVEVGPNNRLVNTATREVIAENPQPTAGNETWTTLTPEESQRAGYRPGVVVRRSSSGKEEVVDEPNATGGQVGPDGQPLPKLSPQTEGQLSTIRETNTQAQDMVTKAREFISINRRWKKTGGLMAAPFAKEMVAAFDKDVARMNTIANDIIPKLRVPGSGTTSDRDAARFEKATLGVGQPYETNESTYQAVLAYADRYSDYNDFMDSYALRYGTLVGAQGMWDRYVADPKNDVTMFQGDKLFARVPDQTWREYMKWDDQQNRPTGSNGRPEVVTNYVWDPVKGLIPQ